MESKTVGIKQVPSLTWHIRRVRADSAEFMDDQVVMEEPLEVVVNGQSVAVLMRLPGREKELAAGFCVSEGYVRSADDILVIHHCGRSLPAPGPAEEEADDSRNRVELRVTQEGFHPPAQPGTVRLIRSGCGAADVSVLDETLPEVTGDLQVAVEVLLDLNRTLRDAQQVHNSAGGTHAAALFTATGEPEVVAEDIGRHNALDKVIGHCLLRHVLLVDKVLVTTGRASYEMAMKAVRLGIPIVATVSAPTSLAVQLAESRGLTLIGYLRGGRMNVYTHTRRVVT
ncbi:MAG: formate dehydrogenase accessory sulfurtransferase FdhD [Chloroflexota bacterium]|nr:formate dehydrogenase accessory sulfurtransferase FdhD [Chloroflexota bacterium]